MKARKSLKKGRLTPSEHRNRHIELHKALDELVADYIDHIPLEKPHWKGLRGTSIMTLMEWSFEQTQEPEE